MDLVHRSIPVHCNAMQALYAMGDDYQLCLLRSEFVVKESEAEFSIDSASNICTPAGHTFYNSHAICNKKK